MIRRTKQIAAVVLAVALAASMAACGGKKNVKVEKAEDLKGLNVGVQVNTTAHDSAKEFMKSTPFELKTYDQVIMPFQDLKSGRLDAVIVDEVVARHYVVKDSKSYKVAVNKLTNEPIGIAFKKGNDALRDKVNVALEDLRKSGKLGEISKKWFGDDLTANLQMPDDIKKLEDKLDTKSTADALKGKTVLKVGLDDTYPPMEFKDDSNKLVGFDVDMATAIGEKLGVKVEFVPTAWDGIFASLNSDRYDCIISSVSLNEERIGNFAMSKAYVSNAQVIVTRP